MRYFKFEDYYKNITPPFCRPPHRKEKYRIQSQTGFDNFILSVSEMNLRSFWSNACAYACTHREHAARTCIHAHTISKKRVERARPSLSLTQAVL